MKILIIDHDDVNAQMIRAKLEPAGHNIVTEPNKEKAVEKASSDDFDVIFFDPTPLTDPRKIIIDLRRYVGAYVYIILLSSNINLENAIKAGANDILGKPLDNAALDQKLDNAQHMFGLVRRIADDSEDFPSAGGVIAKSAFNQLFLSALERADRYGERTFILFIAISNYQEILELDGAYAADYAVAKLSQYLVHLRRQSDIIGQTAKYEYALLLQRPVYETEPVEAANRFAVAMQDCEDIVSSGVTGVEINVSLIELPQSARPITHDIRPAEQNPESES